jgi:large subunit ribosomal protein L25
MEHKLSAQPREVVKKQVKQLRKAGFVPAAIFGYKGNFNVQLPIKEFTKVFSDAGHSTIVDIDVNGTIHSVLVDEVQINPLTRDAVHVSLREVRMDEEITVEVTVELSGEEESPAVKDEETLIILTQSTIEVRGLPKSLPSEITIDVSGFHAGDTLTLTQIKLPEGVHLVSHQLEEGEEQDDPTIVTTASAIQEEVAHTPSVAELEATAAETAEGATPAEGAATEEKKDE